MTRAYRRLVQRSNPTMNYAGKCRLCRTPMHVVARSADLMVCQECRRVVLCVQCLHPHNRNSQWCSAECRLEYQKTVRESVVVEVRKKSS